MGAMTEDSGRWREETLFINHQPLILKEGRRWGGAGRGATAPSSCPPPLLFTSSVFRSMIVVCLPTCFFISLHFLLPVHIIFFFFNLITFLSFPMIEYLTMQQFSHFLSSLSPLLRFIVAERCGAGAQRKADEGHN